MEITKLKRRVKKLEWRNKVKVLKLRRLQKVGTVQRIDTSDDTVMNDVSNQEKVISDMDVDANVVLEEAKEVVIDAKVDQDTTEEESEPAELQEIVDIVTTAKLTTEVITAASTIITTVEVLVPPAATIAAPTLTAAPRRRIKGVVIRDPEESSTITSIIIHSEAKSKDKGKGILVEEPKPLKKQAQIKQDEKYARELKAELNRIIDWDEVIDHVNKKAKEDKFVKRVLKRINETPAKKPTKRQKLNEEVEELKRHIQIVPNEDDDVYTEATPLAQKVPVVDYEIINQNNKPYYKIIRADGTHQLYISFLSLLRKFDIEDLEALWSLVKERFATVKPKNFFDDFLLITLGAMFKKLDMHAQIWKNQRSVHGSAKVKGWKLLESCGVQIITFTTTQLILLVERKYPLTRFTLDQMLNDVRLEVEQESEVSLELLRMPPKRSSTSEASTMSPAAIRKLVADSIVAALETQTTTMAEADNSIREIPVAKRGNYKEFISCQPFYFNGTEGVVGLICWFKRTESVFSQSKCAEENKVAFATGTRTNDALSRWNAYAQPIGIEQANRITWTELKRLLTNKYCPRTEIKKMEDEFYNLTYGSLIGRLPRSIKGNVTASKPQTLEEAINIAQSSFDVIIGMDWLSNNHAKTICDEKVVHIPIEDETLIIRALVARAPYRLAPSELKELSNQLQELADRECEKPSGLLIQPKIPIWKWERITMDFVTKLPRKSNGHDTIWVIFDRLAKYAYFIHTQEAKSIETLTWLYIKEIISRHGIPISIILDRDSHFTSRFWQSLKNALGTQLDMSAAYHLETDGQSERTIQTLEDMLRACVIDFGKEWEKHLPL
nr:reverse transcriptase domain-containing protein [Tanacetum cinerariifolium]